METPWFSLAAAVVVAPVPVRVAGQMGRAPTTTGTTPMVEVAVKRVAAAEAVGRLDQGTPVPPFKVERVSPWTTGARVVAAAATTVVEAGA